MNNDNTMPTPAPAASTPPAVPNAGDWPAAPQESTAPIEHEAPHVPSLTIPKNSNIQDSTAAPLPPSHVAETHAQPIAPPIPAPYPPSPPTPQQTLHAATTPPQIVLHTMESDMRNNTAPTLPHTPPLREPSAQPSFTLPEHTPRKSNISRVLSIFLVLVLLGGVGYAGYVFIAPIFSPKTPSAVAPTTQTNESQSISTSSAIMEQSAPTHTSLLHIPADKAISINLPSLDAQAVTSALSNLPAETPGTLEEITLNMNGVPVPFASFAGLYLKNVPLDIFGSDMSLELYHDASGVWPVVVTTFSTSTPNAVLEQSSIRQAIEQDSQSTITQLFLNNPGAPRGNFLDGSIPGVATQLRYRVFQGSVSLDYGWIGDKFVVATSYAALKEVAARL